MASEYKRLPLRAAIPRTIALLQLLVVLAFLLLAILGIISLAFPALEGVIESTFITVVPSLTNGAVWIVLGIVVVTTYAIAEVRSFQYRVTHERFELSHGVLARRQVILELPKIQHVEIQQSFWGRLMRIAMVLIRTAGSGGAVILPGVDIDEATRLQTSLEGTVTPHESRTSAHVNQVANHNPDSSQVHRISPKAIWLFSLGNIQNILGLILFVVIATAFVVADITSVTTVLTGLGTLLVLAVLYIFVEAWLKFRHVRYRFGADTLMVQRGVWSRTRSTIRWDRVQNVEIRETLAHRILGLADLRIQTAGSGSVRPEAVIPGLELDRAEQLRDEAIRTIDRADGV